MRRLSLACLFAASFAGFFACTGDDPVLQPVITEDAGTTSSSSSGSTSSSGSVTDGGDTTDGPGPGVDAGPCNLAADFPTPAKITAASSLDLEAEPTLTDNELTLYFARGGKIYSLSRASRDVDFAGDPKEVVEVDTDPTLSWQSASITRDGQTLLVGVKTALYLATVTGSGKFGAPKKIDASGDVSGEHPYITFDQSGVYYNGPPGPAQTIKHATILSTTAWNNVTTLTEFGATGNRYPVVTADEQTMYFASSRAGGKGGDDIWVATRKNKTDKWGAFTPLAGPINTDGNEAPSWLSSDGCRLYLIKSGNGSINYDIYVSTKPH